MRLFFFQPRIDLRMWPLVPIVMLLDTIIATLCLGMVWPNLSGAISAWINKCDIEFKVKDRQ